MEWLATLNIILRLGCTPFTKSPICDKPDRGEQHTSSWYADVKAVLQRLPDLHRR